MKNKVVFKPEDVCILIKVWIKIGSTSKKTIKGQEIILSNFPVLGEPLMVIREGEYHNGIQKRSRHRITSSVLSLKNIAGIGLQIETETSVFLLLKK